MFSQVLRPLGSTWRMRQVKIRKKLKIDPPYCTYCAAHSYWSELHGSFKGASLFFKERQERFAHGHSFLKRDESDSIQKSDSEQFATLAHYKNWQWAIRLPCSLKRSNRSDWLFFMSESFFRSKKTNDSLKKPKREFPTLVLFVGRSVCAPTWVCWVEPLRWEQWCWIRSTGLTRHRWGWSAIPAV